MTYSDTLNDVSYVNDDETLVIHNAYKNELRRLSKVHQRDLDDLEKCYQEQILFIIKEKESISSQLVSILQSLIKCFEHEFKVEHQVNNGDGEKINFNDRTFQGVIEMYEIKQNILFNQIYKLKKAIMEEKKTKANLSSTIIVLKEKNFILKQYLDELNKNSTTRFPLRCLAASMFYQKKDETTKLSKIRNLFESILLVLISVWSILRLENFYILVLLNIIAFGIGFFLMI